MYEKEIKHYIEARGGLSALAEEEKSTLVESAFQAKGKDAFENRWPSVVRSISPDALLDWVRNSLKQGNTIYVEKGKIRYKSTPEAAKKKFPFKVAGDELVMLAGKKEIPTGTAIRSTKNEIMIRSIDKVFKIVDL